MDVNQNRLNLTKMRDLMEFKKCGIDLSTTSNEAAKLWDSLLFQMFGLFDAPEINGISGALNSIQTIDPEFPLTNLIALDFSNCDLDKQLNKLTTEMKNQNENVNTGRKWTEYERLHLKAMVYRLKGYDDLAAECWLQQLVKYPQDLLALKCLTDYYILSGESQEIANTFSLTRREMSVNDVYYPFILGYEAFGLEEKGRFNEAMNMANESLGIYSWNSWATHTIAHVFDSNGNYKSGLEFMNRTKDDWIQGNLLTCHNIWHTALFHLDEGDTNAALELWDSEIHFRLKKQYSHFGMSDAVSFLSRIEFSQTNTKKSESDINLSERWTELSASIGKFADKCCGIGFYDAHLALALMGCKKQSQLEKLMHDCNDWILKYENKIFEELDDNSFLKSYQEEMKTTKHYVTKSKRIVSIIESLKLFMDGDYQGSVNILYPIRNELRNIGGSNIQNDVFYQLLASALYNAGGFENTARLKKILLDRKNVKNYSRYYEGIERQILNVHSSATDSNIQ